MKSDELLEQALVYERAVSRVERYVTAENKALHIDKIAAKAEGRDVDPSFVLAITAINKAKIELAKKSADLLRLAEKAAKTTEEPFLELLTAVQAKAASDYELALCGFLPEYEIHNIEAFASYGKLLPEILTQIKAAKPKFDKIVKEHFEDIVADTEEMHKRGRDVGPWAKYRCPLCGGGLYKWGRLYYGLRQIRCTGCDFRANER